ncbi:glutathione S-transferase-like [Porites lutea]|uniref:glutathione S-transferase-like n=1 Tax=Porites lutea TaxID=51062 RepID=UPI003CC57F8E
MSGYKLYYFPARAKGEIDRWAFAAAKIDFEDIRLNFGEEWRKEKESGRPPLGQMPFLVTPEGKILAQSGAIMKYIWKKAGLSPSDSFDEAVADMIHDGASDLRDLWLRTHFEKDEAAKETKMKEFLETTLPARLEKYEALLKSKDEGKGFFLGAKLSYADISFVEFINSFSLMVKKQKDDGKPAPDLEELFKKFPLLDGHYKRVLNVPEIKAWVEKRPASDV